MKKFIACAALSTLLLCGCSIGANNEGIIKVNNVTITKTQFDKAYDRTVDSSFMKSFGGAKNLPKTDDNVMYLMFKEKVVNELIVKALLDDEIAKRGIKVTNDDVQKELQTITDKVGSKEELGKLLKQRGISNSQFMEDLKTQIRIKKLIDSVSKVTISDKDAEKYYNSHKTEFVKGEQVRASHILIAFNTLDAIQNIKSKDKKLNPTELNVKVEELGAAQKAKAEAILKEAKAHPDQFEKLAQKNSDDKVSGERGGELGFFTKEAMVPEFSKVAFSMKPNTISDNLVKTQYGYHIIKVTDRTEAGVTPFVKVKDELKFYLTTQKQMEILKNLTAGLMKNAKIEYLDSTYKPDPNAAKKALEKQAAQKKALEAATKSSK